MMVYLLSSLNVFGLYFEFNCFSVQRTPSNAYAFQLPNADSYYPATTKDRDEHYIKNWRPIFVINIDAKILSKALAKRMCKVLPNIIHPEQCAYVKDRLISDVIRTSDDVMWYTRSRDIERMLVATDFEKAFDPVDLKFLGRVLEVFNCGPDFIQWIKTFCRGAKSCDMNNGYTSHYFDLGHKMTWQHFSKILNLSVTL